jgi:uncharacterized protein YcbK (DUF882 family)
MALSSTTINQIKTILSKVGYDLKVNNLVLTAVKKPSIYMTAADWKANKYFELSEFKCKHYCNGYPVNVKKKLITALTKIRVHFGKPVYITSGLRCRKYNSTLRHASALSLHLTGGAADFYVKGADIKAVLRYCAYLKARGYIRYYYTNNTNMRGAVHINI